MKPIPETSNGTVAAEGTAFNAPSSIRTPTNYEESQHPLEPAPLMAEDELDLQEQLSRLNSDFEDGLDVARHTEQIAAEPCSFMNYLGSLALQLKRNALPVLSNVCMSPVAIGVGLVAVGVGIGIALSPSRARTAKRAG